MKSSNIRYLAGYVGKHTKSLVIVFIALLSVSAALLSMGSVVRRLVDDGLGVERISEVNSAIYSMIACIVIFSVSSFFRSYYINLIAVQVTSKLKVDTYQKLLKVKLARFEELKIGDIISRLGSDIEVIGSLVINFLSFFIRNMIMLCGSIILMFIQSPKLSFLVLVSVPVFLVPLLKLSRHVRKLARQVLIEQGALAANVEESFLGVRTVYAYNQQEFLADQFNSKVASYIKHASTRLKFRSLFFALAIVVIAASIISVIWIGSLDIISGAMSSGQMISFIYYAIIVGMSAGGIAELFSEIQGPLAALDRIVELKNLEQVNSLEVSKKKLTKDYTIEFDKVSFSYPSRPDILALNNISLKIKQGQFTGIVGRSGSGKSTLMQLLLKFYHHQLGSIFFGGVDINQLKDHIIRSKIAYVEQYPTIFSGTIRSNIAFSNPSALDKNIEKIAKLCGIMEFAKDLEYGLDTEIGERGVRISGGQKQRIAIARALLYKPEILLLDEATSALDNDSEIKILQNVRSLMKDKTIISIAHRISSLEKADEILVINQGKLVDTGSHEVLLKASKIYNILYKEQTN